MAEFWAAERASSLFCSAVFSASSRARFSFSITRNSEPASGTPERPVHLTAMEGPALFTGLPRSSMSARTLP